MVDLTGTQINHDEITLLKQPAVGGVILFSRNYQSKKQLAELVAEIKSLRKPSLLIAVDQEGGRVQRFKEGFYELPAARTIGKVFEDDMQKGMNLAYHLGEIMAGELVGIGIDISFAPVLDCANLDSSVIGDRGFSNDPSIIVSLAGSFIDGMNASGMAATGKHFPGHGGVSEDSHSCLPIDTRNLQTLLQRDILPFSRLSNRLGGIMTAHVQYQQIDSALPSFSYYWLETILRQRLGYKGAIFSDDMTMQGAVVAGNPFTRTSKALESGCDMVLICNDSSSTAAVSSSLGNTCLKSPKRIEAMRAIPKKTAVDLAIIRSSLAY